MICFRLLVLKTTKKKFVVHQYDDNGFHYIRYDGESYNQQEILKAIIYYNNLSKSNEDII